MENNNVEVIGIDHGWANMKSSNEIFISGIKEITTEPALYDNVLEYKGKYYKIGGKRLEVKKTKVEDENYYLLTLAAIAKELERKGLRSANVFLAVGLPLTRFGAEKQGFIDYLSKNRQVTFRFEKRTYNITIFRVSVFPQCYAAVTEQISDYIRKRVVVDIGSWTIDIMPIEDKSPDESRCRTVNEGLLTCMRTIKDECIRQLNGSIEESDIKQVMMYGKSEIDSRYYAIIESEIKRFVTEISNKLIEYGYNLETTPITFVGGGATVMKLFGNLKQSNIQYIDDVKANAKGYEYLAKVFLNSRRKAR